MTSAYEARYALDGGIVQIAIDVRNGKVFKLIAGDGYKGKLFGRIAVGMPVAEALAADDRMYYDEAAELLLIRGVDGVALEVPLDDPTSEEAVVSHISAISVFVPEIETLAGIEGRW
jgi:hypothetical protein